MHFATNSSIFYNEIVACPSHNIILNLFIQSIMIILNVLVNPSIRLMTATEKNKAKINGVFLGRL
jgi:hypothetical protein